jgi:hypothetical protein
MNINLNENTESKPKGSGFQSIAQKMKELELKIKRLQEKSSDSEQSVSDNEEIDIAEHIKGGKKVQFKNILDEDKENEENMESDDCSSDRVQDLIQISNENKNKQILKIKKEIEDNIFKTSIRQSFEENDEAESNESDYEDQDSFMTPKLYSRQSIKSNKKRKINSFGNTSTANTNKHGSENQRKTQGVKVISVFKNFGDQERQRRNSKIISNEKSRIEELERELEISKQKLQKTVLINKEMHNKFETLESKYSKLLDLFEKTNKRLLHYKSELDVRKNCGTCNFKQKRKVSENKKFSKNKLRKKQVKTKTQRSSLRNSSNKKNGNKKKMRNSILAKKQRKRESSRGSVKSRRSSRGFMYEYTTNNPLKRHKVTKKNKLQRSSRKIKIK